MNPELKALLEKQQGILNTAKNANRDLTTEEQTQFDDLQRQIDEELKNNNRSNNPTPPVPTPSPEDTQRALALERQRISELSSLCRSFNVDSAQTERFITEGTTIDQVRSFILERQLKDGAPSFTKVTVDEKDKFRAAATDGLALRLGMDVKKPAPGATDFRSLSLRELAKETLRMEGVNNAFRLSDEEMLRQYLNPTSTFTGIIDTTARTVFEQAYTEAETTYQTWTRKGTLKDFRPTKTYQTGTAGELKLVKEGGELEHDNPNGFEGAQRQLLTFGRQFTMTREAFINDDVGFLNTLPALYAQSARLGINKLVYKTLAENASIYDGKKLFSNDHTNVSGISGAPSIDTISAMRQLMRKQTAPGGAVKMNISPKYMIVPTSLETKAGQLIGSAVDPNGVHSAVQNPFYNSLTIISDAELDDATANGEKEWYLAADALRAAIQVDFLNGIDMPTIQMRQAPAGQLGFAWDIFIDYGVTVTDYRTLVKNNGQ